MKIEWTTFKAFVVARSLSIQWVEDTAFYYLSIFDGTIKYECELDKNPTDSTNLNDFVNNFKAIGNASLSDIDGIPFYRLKASKKGWSYWAVPVEFSTSTLSGTLFCQDSAGNDISWVNCKIYKADGSEITTAGLAGINLTQCVKTVVDFEPTFDYEIVGGSLRVNSNPSQDVRLWIVGAPDIPAQYGGSKEFASGINVKFLAADNVLEVDGRVTKYMTYNATDHRGKLRMILKHPAGANVSFMIIIEIYRQ